MDTPRSDSGIPSTEAALLRIRNGLIVSCPTHPTAPYETREVLEGFVHAVIDGGAHGVRLEGGDFIAAIRPWVDLPIIGFTRGAFEDGDDLITPEIADIGALFSAGATIVAMDVTRRKRPNGRDGFEFLAEARQAFPGILCADVSNFREGVLAAEIGADLIATTLCGHTAYSLPGTFEQPDIELIMELQSALTIPILAEGRIWSPEQAAAALAAGAWAVVAGAAITKPRVITEMFVHALHEGSVEKAG